jgi:ribosome biogenesis GTPase / thiamine phosphate phosphatase
MTLEELGWNIYNNNQLTTPGIENKEIGRVSAQNKTNYILYSSYQDLVGIVRGNLLKSSSRSELPQVGDWVTFTKLVGEDKAVIEKILPRKTTISRKMVESEEEQVIATNVDILFIVLGLDSGINTRLLERYLLTGKGSGARVIIVFNKSDIGRIQETEKSELEQTASGVPYHLVSARSGDGISEIRNYITQGITVAFIGPSGVGKSSLINALLKTSAQKISDVNDTNHKGRHTTTRRELLLLPDGGLLIDTPGMREVGIWTTNESIADTFADLYDLAQNCRYTDCDHEKSSECAIIEAVNANQISTGRYQSFLKLQKEIAFQKTKEDQTAKLASKRKEKKQNKSLNKRLKEKYN